jgi:hypothetical protein
LVPETLKQVLQHEGPVAIVTGGSVGPHVVNTWNTYVQFTEDDRMLIPAGGMKTTEANLNSDPHVQLTAASRETPGKRGMGAGFLIKGTAKMISSGSEYDAVKAKFSWARAALTVTVDEVTQTF